MILPQLEAVLLKIGGTAHSKTSTGTDIGGAAHKRMGTPHIQIEGTWSDVETETGVGHRIKYEDKHGWECHTRIYKLSLIDH